METVEKTAIQELTARYNMAVDTNDVDMYLSAWMADGVSEAAFGSARGHEQLRERFIGMQQGMSKNKRHVTINSIIHLHGRRATQTCYLLVFDRLVAAVIATGFYEDELIQTDEGWKFSKRTLLIDASFQHNKNK